MVNLIAMADLGVGTPQFRSRSEIGTLFQSCSMLGTKSHTDWKAFGVDPQGLLGVVGQANLATQPKINKNHGASASGVNLQT